MNDVLVEIANEYSGFTEVQAVVLSGSRTGHLSDPHSDVDLYIYLNKELPLSSRKQVAERFGQEIELGNAFFEPGDEWVDRSTGIHLDAMFRMVQWIESQIERVLLHHQASVGYSTCFWFNVLHSELLFDRNGWFEKFQESVKVPYPEELRTAVIRKNLPLLQDNHSSLLHQMELALNRKDEVSLHHRISALLSSYFDVLFALNRLPHPGEKRLVAYALQNCAKLPSNFEAQIYALLHSEPQRRLEIANSLIEGLEDLVTSEDYSG